MVNETETWRPGHGKHDFPTTLRGGWVTPKTTGRHGLQAGRLGSPRETPDLETQQFMTFLTSRSSFPYQLPCRNRMKQPSPVFHVTFHSLDCQLWLLFMGLTGNHKKLFTVIPASVWPCPNFQTPITFLNILRDSCRTVYLAKRARRYKECG